MARNEKAWKWGLGGHRRPPTGYRGNGCVCVCVGGGGGGGVGGQGASSPEAGDDFKFNSQLPGGSGEHFKHQDPLL